LPRAGTITFGQLTAGLVERLEVIVRFLAVLELFKRGWIDLVQRGNFAELQVTWMGTEGEDREPVALSPIEEYQG
jgi:segregation and condensation protein A